MTQLGSKPDNLTFRNMAQPCPSCQGSGELKLTPRWDSFAGEVGPSWCLGTIGISLVKSRKNGFHLESLVG
jgi:hypothetical protein